MLVDLTNPVPDIGELVTYNFRGTPEGQRIAGWYKLQKLEEPEDPIIAEILREDKTSIGYVLTPCTRDEATVVELVGIAGHLIRINNPNLIRTGCYVNWNDDLINEHRHSFIMRLASRYGIGLGRGYLDTLKRLFPEVDFTYPY